MKVQYEEIGLPQEPGLYACRIHDPRGARRIVDVFLFWFTDRWLWWNGSAEMTSHTYEGDVIGWIGPLPRLRPLQTDVEAPR